MGIDKPKIAILMAVYKPNIDWFAEQLNSINYQTYKNISIYICDDGSGDRIFVEIKECVEKYITKFPIKLIKNDENSGSNKTFERLTEIAEGDYFAYSDQDDIWYEDKINTLYELIKNNNAVLSYSDMNVIDGNGGKLADSLKILRPRLEYLSGDGLFEKYFFRNCTAGCSMLIKSEIAKKAMPFPENTMCDQWLCMIAAISGKISFCEKPLVQYRQHGNNQTGVLTGVTDNQTYYEKRLLPLKERMEYMKKYLQISEGAKEFVNSRLDGNIVGIIKGRKYSPFEAKFEILRQLVPDTVFSYIIKKIKK